MLNLAAEFAQFISPLEEEVEVDEGSRRLDELARAALAGDDAAWQTLFCGFNSQLWKLYQHKGASEAEASELAHQTWLHVRKSHEQFGDDGRFLPYIFVAVYRVWEDERRRKRLRDGVLPPLPEDLPAASLPAAASLSEEEVALISLHFLEDVPFDELDERFGLSGGTAQKKCLEAVKRLVQCIF